MSEVYRAGALTVNSLKSYLVWHPLLGTPRLDRYGEVIREDYYPAGRFEKALLKLKELDTSGIDYEVGDMSTLNSQLYDLLKAAASRVPHCGIYADGEDAFYMEEAGCFYGRFEIRWVWGHFHKVSDMSCYKAKCLMVLKSNAFWDVGQPVINVQHVESDAFQDAQKGVVSLIRRDFMKYIVNLTPLENT